MSPRTAVIRRRNESSTGSILSTAPASPITTRVLQPRDDAVRPEHGLKGYRALDLRAPLLVPNSPEMLHETTYRNACAHLAALMDQVTDTREPILIRRRGGEPVALVPAVDLAGWMETAYLLRSPRNAERLLDASPPRSRWRGSRAEHRATPRTPWHRRSVRSRSPGLRLRRPRPLPDLVPDVVLFRLFQPAVQPGSAGPEQRTVQVSALDINGGGSPQGPSNSPRSNLTSMPGVAGPSEHT